VVIVPGLKKGAFIVGAKYGRGFVSCRKKDGVGWSAPGSIRVEGGSFGFQIGGSETDVFMLVMNEGGMKRLLSTKFTLGGDASVAAGPVGRSTQAETDAALTAEILTWSRSKGLFAGISLSGATLREDGEWNAELYGRNLPNREILTTSVAPPPAAAELLSELNRYSSRK
jgi:lipid-binding SYLF domain-containing protein